MTTLLPAILFSETGRRITMKVSQDVIMRTFHETTMLVSKIIVHSNNHKDALNVFDELDIEATMKMGEALVQELSKKVLTRESVRVCLRYLYRAISDLKERLQGLNTELNEFSKRYFQHFRYPVVEPHIKNIKKSFEVMTNRLEMLIKILQTTP